MPARPRQYYNWTLDELQYAAESGFDGVCTNEHHQNAYGFMVNPNMMGSVLARATRGSQYCHYPDGRDGRFPQSRLSVSPKSMQCWDCISEGRMVAGFPVGLGGDFAHSYGFCAHGATGAVPRSPMNLSRRPGQAEDVFSWNGKYYQLPMVSVWPRPVQKPHPPIWVPGNASPSTWDFVLKNDYCYCYLTYFGAKGADKTVGGYWKRAAELGRDNNPYRLGYLIPVGVAETDTAADDLYARHIEIFLPQAAAHPGGPVHAAGPHDPQQPELPDYQTAAAAVRYPEEEQLQGFQGE